MKFIKYILLAWIVFPQLIIAQQSPVLSFNHFYKVLDSNTYELLKQNPFFNELCGVDAGLPAFAKPDSSTSILYIRGKDTYLELMSPDNRFKVPVHHTGIGFSWDSVPFSSALSDAVHRETDLTAYQHSTAFINIRDVKLAWYKAYFLPDSQTSLFTWYAIYNSQMLNELYPGAYHPTYTRSAMLNAGYDQHKLIKNVYSVDLQCTLSDYNRISGELEQLTGVAYVDRRGYKVYNVNNCLIRLTNRKKIKRSYIKRSYINKVEFLLNRPDQRKVKLGNLVIRNKGTHSQWTFL